MQPGDKMTRRKPGILPFVFSTTSVLPTSHLGSRTLVPTWIDFAIICSHLIFHQHTSSWIPNIASELHFAKSFQGTPLDHIWRAQICTPNTVFGRIWACIWACQIWSSGVSLKRSCKMQFKRVGLRSIGPSSQKFGRFPHCNYNVKLEMACRMSFMGL